MRPSVKIIEGARLGDEFLIEEKKPLIFGRDRSLQASLPEQKISRRHAQVYLREDPSFQLVLEDLGSLNGTYLNGQRIDGPTELSDGDKFRIGPFILEVSIPFVRTNPGMPLEPNEDRSLFNRMTSSEEQRASVPEIVSDLNLQQEDVAEEAYQSFVRPIQDEEENLEETGGRLIHGRIEELSLPDVLQMLQTTRKSGLLVVDTEKLNKAPESKKSAALLYLKDGNLIHANYRGLENEEAFYAALKMETGYFALFPSQKSDFSTIMQTPIEALLLEGMRRLDEEKMVAESLSPTDLFEVRAEEQLSELSTEELKIFQIIWRHHSMKQTLSNSPYDAQQTEEIVRKLLRNNFIRKVD